MNGGAAGAVKAADAGGVNGDTGGDGDVNSGNPVEADGGVAVAATDARSTDSGLGLGAAWASALGGDWGGGAGGRCMEGTAEARGPLLNGGGSQPSCPCGVERGRAWEADSEPDVPELEVPTRGAPDAGVF
jgi:hypothetical protein